MAIVCLCFVLTRTATNRVIVLMYSCLVNNETGRSKIRFQFLDRFIVILVFDTLSINLGHRT